MFYCICTSRNITTINHTPVLDSKALFWHRYYCSYLFIPPVFHYLFAKLVHLLGVLGTQETSCFVVAGLLERDIFDLFLPEFDKPWVIHLRETCCCSTNLCTWRPNTVYKNRSVRRHQALFWRRCRGGERLKVLPLDSAILSFCFLFLFSLVRLNGK